MKWNGAGVEESKKPSYVFAVILVRDDYSHLITRLMRMSMKANGWIQQFKCAVCME